MPSYIIQKAVNLKGTVARDIRRIRRNTSNLANKKSDASLYLQCTKIAVAFVFLAGTINFLGTEGFNNIKPMHASADEEVRMERNNEYTNGNELFLDAKLQNSLEISEEGDEDPIGGSVDSTLSTVEGSAVFASRFITIPEAPPQERDEIVKYEVKPNDRASNIAASFGLKVDTIVGANNLKSADYIVPGQKLLILPEDGLVYEVKQGDTLSSIATRYKSETDKILTANDIEDATHIFAGQTLIIPDGVKPAPQPKTQSSPQPAPRYAASNQNTAGYFIRPTTGRISQWLHPTNAVDIAGGCRQQINAAAGGTVTHAVANGYWNGGFGNYVIISHPNGTRTLYAHMYPGGVYVRTGQRVSQGEIIGITGTTGRSTGCHLHYEVHGARNNVVR